MSVSDLSASELDSRTSPASRTTAYLNVQDWLMQSMVDKTIQQHLQENVATTSQGGRTKKVFERILEIGAPYLNESVEIATSEANLLADEDRVDAHRATRKILQKTEAG
jgi:hypothetical protein